MTDQERIRDLEATIERAKEWRAMSEHELEAEKARADKAEACCAEMRSIMESFVPGDPIATQQLTRALSLDCGKGLLTELEQLKARNQRLREALKPFVEEHYKSAQRTDMGPVEFICTAQMIEAAEQALAAEKEKP